MLPTTTTCPSPEASSAGRNAFVTRTVPRKFSSYIRRQASSSASAIVSLPNAPPALFTSTRTSGTWDANAATEPGSVTSSGSARAEPPSRSMEPATSSRRSSRRAPRTTANPSAASDRAVAAPIPEEAPVTIAVPLSASDMAASLPGTMRTVPSTHPPEAKPTFDPGRRQEHRHRDDERQERAPRDRLHQERRVLPAQHEVEDDVDRQEHRVPGRRRDQHEPRQRDETRRTVRRSIPGARECRSPAPADPERQHQQEPDVRERERRDVLSDQRLSRERVRQHRRHRRRKNCHPRTNRCHPSHSHRLNRIHRPATGRVTARSMSLIVGHRSWSFTSPSPSQATKAPMITAHPITPTVDTPPLSEPLAARRIASRAPCGERRQPLAFEPLDVLRPAEHQHREAETRPDPGRQRQP